MSSSSTYDGSKVSPPDDEALPLVVAAALLVVPAFSSSLTISAAARLRWRVRFGGMVVVVPSFCDAGVKFDGND